MKTFAIETSCDDTSFALVREENGHFTCEKMLTDTQKFHDNYGGVVPEMASRAHAERILPLFDRFLSELSWTKKDFSDQVDCISITVTPGLPGSLIMGKTFGQMLGLWFDKPILEVNHLYGHVLSLFLERSLDDLPLPMLVLSVSGGHSDLYLVKSEEGTVKNGFEKYRVGPYAITKLGATRDDAAGEAFDKVARMLGGPYPGGKWIGERAEQGKMKSEKGITNSSEKGIMNSDKIEAKKRSPYYFKRTMLEEGSLDFSFSGMKSQAYNFIVKSEQLTVKNEKGKMKSENTIGTNEQAKNSLSEEQIDEIAYEFQEAITDVLSKKLLGAVEQFGAQTIGLVGGVSANKRLREKILTDAQGASLVLPTKFDYCMDNAAMIGVVGLLMAQEKSN